MKVSLPQLLLTGILACASTAAHQTNEPIQRLVVSKTNPHLLETESGKPVFLNNFTAWKLIEHGTREDMREVVLDCKKNRYNMISSMILGIREWEGRTYETGVTPYGAQAFEKDPVRLHDPLKPITTPGNDPEVKGEYDFWDHVEYLVDLTASEGMYISLHPAWGNWFQGYVHGKKPDDVLLFDDRSAYGYGNWLGKRFGHKKNIIWMIGGDRSAVNDSRTRWYAADSAQDFRPLYRAMAEGLADGVHGVSRQDGTADYNGLLMSYHPRKWGPNSSDWFHNEPWLHFNSVQDTPVDILVAMEKDYALTPVKPTWLYEPRYEGAVYTWAVRYQAYHSVFAGGFGTTYGSDAWEIADGWRELLELPGNKQMAYLYTVVRGIWSDEEYMNRMPDKSLIVGERGKIYGRGIFTVGDFENKKGAEDESSDLNIALRSKNGDWAMVYSSNGRPFELDLSKLEKGKADAFWFNPRNGKWRLTDGNESDEMLPALKQVATGTGTRKFTPPGGPGTANDWVLVLK